MKKSELKQKLTDLGIEFDNKATVKQLTALLPEEKPLRNHGDREGNKIYFQGGISPGETYYIGNAKYKAMSEEKLKTYPSGDLIDVIQI